jgi:hypothetical protein
MASLIGFAVVAGAHAPQAGDAVDHLPAVVRREMHAVGGHEYPGIILEAAVGREREPVVLHVEILISHGGLLHLKRG